MYGQFTGNLREDSPVRPTKKGKVRAAMAQEILDAHAAWGKVLVPRSGWASDFFGPYDTAAPTSYAILPAGQGCQPDGEYQPAPHLLVHQDFGAVLLASLAPGTRRWARYGLRPDPPVTQTEFVKLMEAELADRSRARWPEPS